MHVRAAHDANQNRLALAGAGSIHDDDAPPWCACASTIAPCPVMPIRKHLALVFRATVSNMCGLYTHDWHTHSGSPRASRWARARRPVRPPDGARAPRTPPPSPPRAGPACRRPPRARALPQPTPRPVSHTHIPICKTLGAGCARKQQHSTAGALPRRLHTHLRVFTTCDNGPHLPRPGGAAPALKPRQEVGALQQAPVERGQRRVAGEALGEHRWQRAPRQRLQERRVAERRQVRRAACMPSASDPAHCQQPSACLCAPAQHQLSGACIWTAGKGIKNFAMRVLLGRKRQPTAAQG